MKAKARVALGTRADQTSETILDLGHGAELEMSAYSSSNCNSVLSSEAQRQAFYTECPSPSYSQSFMFLLSSSSPGPVRLLGIFPKQKLVPLRVPTLPLLHFQLREKNPPQLVSLVPLSGGDRRKSTGWVSTSPPGAQTHSQI